MKKTFFLFPICLIFAFCSRKTVLPPPTGISNVTVGQGEEKVSAEKAVANYGTADKDWTYKTKPETSLNGSWMLEGMLATNGTWSSTEKVESATQANNQAVAEDTAMGVSTGGSTTKKMGVRNAAAKRGANKNALYENAKTRLKLDYKSGSAIDTSALEPYAYWKQVPAITFAKNAFYGNTGCNSMSGSINYSTKELQFDRNITTSKMACMEYDESNFLSLLKRADTYILNGNMLELRQGSIVLMKYKKS